MIVLRNVDRERNTETLRFNKFCTILNGLVEFIDKGEYYLTKTIDLSMFDYGICKFFNHLNSVYNLDTQGGIRTSDTRWKCDSSGYVRDVCRYYPPSIRNPQR